MLATRGPMSATGVGRKSEGEGPAIPDEQRSWRDEAFDLLSNHRRRFALRHLQRNGERAELGELAERVAAWENGTSVREVSADERKRVYTSLQQVHLPRMDETGIVEFDDRAGVVTLGPAAEDLDLYLEVVEGRDVPWSQYYLLLGTANAGVLGAGYAGLPFFGSVPDIALGVFVLTTFLVSALVHAYYGRTEMRLGTSSSPPEVER